MKNLFVFTDGGARGNPGEAAVGVFIKDQDNKTILEVGKRIGFSTNNAAEYMAVLEALDFLINRKDGIKDSTINFFLDSELVCSQITGIYKVKNNDLKKLLFEIRKKEAKLETPITYKHIRREDNKNADNLVNLALDNML